MGDPCSRHNSSRFPCHLCIFENRVDVVAFVGFCAAVPQGNVCTHRKHAEVGLDAAQKSCCGAGGVGHLVIHAICLRKVGICILLNYSGIGSLRFSPSKVQRMENSQKTKLSLRRPCTFSLPFESGSTCHLPRKLSDFSPS